ncbi:calponin domain-containing protein [Fimicolochytrium jonesii]|uniref:calponin domain-containing protein n=1 Tax=Fimicolochytrium jonesii TaxID=1396493 RepID=UPI0022FF2A55|nr:calponin domain-containing protein [Fimicolochytrium jonesii]KAI8817992.1 calponin homology domain-containing protein [Fimicolochytrium jonesii]
MSGFRNFSSNESLHNDSPTLSSALDADDWDADDNSDPQTVQQTNSAISSPRGSISTSTSALPSSGNNWREQSGGDWLAAKRQQQSSGQTSQPSPVKPFVASPAPNKSSFTKPAIPAHSVPTRPPSKPARQPEANLPTSIPAYPSAINSTGGLHPSTNTTDTPRKFSAGSMGINTQALSAKYPYFTPSEIAAFHQQYTLVDKENRDKVHPSDLSNVATKAGASFQDVTQKLSQLSLVDDGGLVSFEGLLKAVSKVREDKGAAKQTGDKQKIVLHGHGENTTHTINEDEKESFTQHINQALARDAHLKDRLPIDPSSMQIFSECKDGLILAKLINDSVPGTIDDRVLNVQKKLNPFHMTENNNVVVNSAKAVGCSVVNIGAQDLIEGREHLILGLIWQIIKIGLQAKIDIKVHPELFRLLETGESLEEFLKLPPEQILLRWFNYHLKKAGWSRKVTNFSGDVKDGENYTVLLAQLAPSTCTRQPLQISDLFERAEAVLQNADKLGCRKYLTAKTLVGGNAKLNFAFVAHLFNTHPGLEKLSEAEMAQLDEWLFSSEGDREARAFALWLNSLGVEPFVNNLFDDLRDGLVLLHAMDKVHPGVVDWKKVNKAPVSSKFKKVENCNYVVVLGKSMRFSLVGIGGVDITDGNKTLTLALVWQLMREHVIQTLRSLSTAGREITDSDMIKWANDTVRTRAAKHSTMASFKDPSLSTSVFFLDLLQGIKKGVVNYELVSPGQSEDEQKMNAKYAISIARKLGATIFVLPEDIVEVKSKMILTFVGTLMALDKVQNAA